ncbi:MAG: HAMP domain-containing protein [Planctomycetota bacterium]|jgi:anti-anti-sigma regulatory factor/HAMP domain-containing protein
MSIRIRTLILLVLVGVAASGLTAHTAYRQARKSLLDGAFQKLTVVRETKAEQIHTYFQAVEGQVLTLSESLMVIGAMREFSEAFARVEPSGDDDLELRLHYESEVLPRLEALPGTPPLADLIPQNRMGQELQRLFLARSPFSLGSRALLDDPGDGSSYADAHARYHPLFRSFLERFGYYDVFLIDSRTGNVVYSASKEMDFGTSLKSGPHRESNLATCFEAVASATTSGSVELVDYSPYLPSYGASASFIASPIFDGDEQVGVLAFQVPIDRIDDIMTTGGRWEDVGLGASGECYIVGADRTLRNESRFLVEDGESYLSTLRRHGQDSSVIASIEAQGSAIGLQVVDTAGVRAVQAGDTGRGVFEDYRGVPVLSSYRPLDLPGIDWALLAEIDEAEALGPAKELRNQIILEQIGIMALIVAGAVFFARSLTRPIERLSGVAASLAKGDLDKPVEVTRRDELGALGASLETMRASLEQMVAKQNEAIDALSTPLISLQEDVVVMPLVGEMDERRIEHVREMLVEGLHKRGARAAILDLTGLPRLDETVATGLARAARSARLLGAEVVITGVQADAARTIVDLDLALEGIRTERTLQDGIEVVLQLSK